jgi:predicted pyridoxine 5'-phosphate oxidase superfamily flavin-nucleotide-binding protein
MTTDIPFHEGELAAQRLAGEAHRSAMSGRAIDPAIPGGALRFIAQQPMAVVGSVDASGEVWASVLWGMPGFLRALDPHTLALDISHPLSAAADPLWRNLRDDPRVGLLLIELGSRRRLRVNGRARREADGPWLIAVEAAYPNCPKYIQRRHWHAFSPPELRPDKPSRRGQVLEPSQIAWIRAADTFFVASAHPRQGVDASHRGGPPGFVAVEDERTLRIPDYAGNSMFNTLGNFLSYPHAGLAFLDFDRGRILQISGRPVISWQTDDAADAAHGIRRHWRLEVHAWQESELPLELVWEFLDYSTFNPLEASAEHPRD